MYIRNMCLYHIAINFLSFFFLGRYHFISMQLQSIIGLLRTLYVALFLSLISHFIVTSGGDVRKRLPFVLQIQLQLIKSTCIVMFHYTRVHLARTRNKSAKRSI